MSTIDVEELQEKIANAKEEKAKAEGAMNQILEQWKKDGINSAEEAHVKVSTLSEQITSLESKQKVLIEDIEAKMGLD